MQETKVSNRVNDLNLKLGVRSGPNHGLELFSPE